jgi:hypothetical protein
MSVKRQHIQSLDLPGQATPFQNELQTIGMRIRKSVSDGYQTAGNIQQQQQQQQQTQTQTQSAFSRVPLPSSVVVPPLLSNNTSTMSTYGSNLEEWESNLDTRLNTIGENMETQGINKRNFENMDEGW